MRLESNSSAIGWRESTKRPAVMLKNPQATFTMGGESPMPRGFANGVGKGMPSKPQARCGMELQKKTPTKNDPR